jgi:hypothetical protein
MGKRLRYFRIEMKWNKLSDGKGVSGIGHLTDKKIDSLQCYYGKAIGDNVNNLANMKRAVWATFIKLQPMSDISIYFIPRVLLLGVVRTEAYLMEHNINIKIDFH